MTTLRTISAALLAEFALTVKSPGYLIEIRWPSGTTRSATFGDLTALGSDWIKTGVRVSQWGQDQTGRANCTLEFDNYDLTWSTLALGDSVSGVDVFIHVVYAGATTDSDIMQDWFVGELNGCQIAQDRPNITFQLARKGEGVLFVPRDVLGAAIGVNHLMHAGKIITIGGQPYTFAPGVQQ
jgi:hypothetical protein